MPAELNEASLKTFLKQEDRVLVLDFWAEWCAPCQVMDPVLAELEEAFPFQLQVGKVNVDDQPTLARLFGIRSIPTLLVFRAGKLRHRLAGLHTSRDLRARLEKWIQADQG